MSAKGSSEPNIFEPLLLLKVDKLGVLIEGPVLELENSQVLFALLLE
jgi:hypothetical protein